MSKKELKEQCLKAYILEHAKEKEIYRIRNEDRKNLIQEDFNNKNRINPKKNNYGIKKRSVEERLSSLEKQLVYALNSIRALTPEAKQQELTKQFYLLMMHIFCG